MSDQIILSRATPFLVRAALPWLVGASVYILLLTFGSRLLNDPDSYSHIAVGRWIVEHGAVPSNDPFSFTMRDMPWVAFEWLSEVTFATAYRIFGWAGVVALAAAAIGLAIALLTRFLLRELSVTLALLMVAAAVALLAPHLLARPHVLALPVMILWASALVRCMDRHAPPPYAALPLLVLWANLHGSVVLALGLIGPAVIEALLNNKRTVWYRELLHWLPFTTLAFMACCLTPYGPASLLIPFTTLGLGDALHWIAEWQPQDFGHFGTFELLLLTVLFALSRGVTLPAVRALVLLGLTHFALAQVRNADLLAVLAPLYLSAPLARQLRRPIKNDEIGSGFGMISAAIAVTVVGTVLALARDVLPPQRNTPEAAVLNSGLAGAGPVLNDYTFGGYLIFVGIPTFIDGRGELYGGPFIARYNRAIALADLPDFLRLLDEYKLGATLLVPDTPASALLDRLPNWQRVYSDNVAVVHKRIPPKQ